MFYNTFICLCVSEAKLSCFALSSYLLEDLQICTANEQNPVFLFCIKLVTAALLPDEGLSPNVLSLVPNCITE